MGQVVPDSGVSNVCIPDDVKLAGSVRVQSTLPGKPLLSAFSVTVRSLLAADVSLMVSNRMPTLFRL